MTRMPVDPTLWASQKGASGTQSSLKSTMDFAKAFTRPAETLRACTRDNDLTRLRDVLNLG